MHAAGTTEILQTAGGEIQVLHATAEQVAQLQQAHQIQILQGDGQVLVSTLRLLNLVCGTCVPLVLPSVGECITLSSVQFVAHA